MTFSVWLYSNKRVQLSIDQDDLCKKQVKDLGSKFNLTGILRWLKF